MKSIPLIRVNCFLPFLTFLDRLGSPVDRWLEEVKLPLFALDDPESLIPRHLAFSFLQKAARAEGIDNLGLLVGQKTSIVSLGNFGRLICGSPSLHDALHTLQKIAPVNNSGERYWLEEGGNNIGSPPVDRAWFCMRHNGDIDVQSPYASQFALMQMVDLLGLAAGKGWRPSEIYLQNRQARNVSESEVFAGINLYTGFGSTAIAFPRSFLSLTLRSSLATGDLQGQRIGESLYSSAPAGDLVGSLQQVLVPLLRGGYPDIHLVAEIAGMSVRTLQRRLEEEGLTYSRLVERARFERSMLWLEDPAVKLVDIATELGYSAPPHFSRAFKRWTGLSPAEFRRQKTGKTELLDR